MVARYSTTQIAEWGWARGGEADCTCGVGPLAGWGWLRGGTDCRMWGRLRCGGGCGVRPLALAGWGWLWGGAGCEVGPIAGCGAGCGVGAVAG